METPDTYVKRAPRTYGRRREPDASDAEVALVAESSASSNQSSPAFSDSGRDVPPSSDFDTSFPHGDDDDDADDAPDDNAHMLAPAHRFDWKRKLKELDSKYDDMEDAPPARGLESDEEEEGFAERRSRPTRGIGAGVDDAASDEVISLPKALFRRSIKDDLARIDMEFDRAEVAGPHKDESHPLSADALDDPFGPPLPILTEDPQLTETRPEASQRPSSPAFGRVASSKSSVHASESEGEEASPPPGVLHPISTPKRGSSPTPPTTEEMAKGKGKEKGKTMADSPVDVDTDELPTVGSSKPSGKAKRRDGEKQKRIKAPTKKERLETQKTTARIKAEQTVTLPRETKPFSTASLFMKFGAKVDEELPPSRVRENPSESSLSDQIEQFSSPAHVERPTAAFVARPSTLRGNPFRSRSTTVEPAPPPKLQFVPNGLLGGPPSRSSVPPVKKPRTREAGADGSDIEISSDSGNELPDVATLLQREKEKRDTQAQHAKLQELKMRLAQQQSATEVDDSSDIEIVDNDMHVVAREEDEERKAMKARHARPSVGRKNQLTLAGRSAAALSPSKTTPLRAAKPDLRALQEAAAPAFSTARMEPRKGKERAVPRVNRNDLNAILLKASEEQSRELTLQKEKEFYRREGAPRDRMPADEEIERAKKERLKELARKGILVAQRRELAEDGDDEAQADEDSDEDWTPAADQDHASRDDAGSEGDDENENVSSRQEAELIQASDDQPEEDQENVPRRLPARRHVMVLDSDEEDDRSGPPTGRVLVADSSQTLDGPPLFALNHRGSVSSFSDRPEEGTDKENDARLAWDRGEDKENTIIAMTQDSITSPFGSRRGRGSLSSLDTPGPPATLQSQQRTPLGELPAEDDEDDPFLSSPSRMPRLRTTSSREGTPGPASQGERSRGLAAFFEPSLPPNDGAGEQEPAQQCSLEPAADIGGEGGFSQFFAPTLKASSSHASVGQGRISSAFFTPRPAPGKRLESQMSLTMGSVERPSLHVDEDRIRKANEIFEKEQEVVAVHAAAEKAGNTPGMYINENGFLTQSATGALLPLSPTSPLFVDSSPAVQAAMSALKSTVKKRTPLGTLALAMDQDEESDSERPRRLHKRTSSPEPGRSSMSPSPVKRRNAFDDLLGRRPGRIQAPKFPKKSAFIEGEAEESDEDAGFGFGVIKKDDEEELDGEDQDKILEELVDDAEMDEDTLNELKVLEKVQEHRELDDAADEKIARDAAEGKMRIKRRNRLLDFEDEESDEEDDDARRRRQRMAKKRKIDGDSLDQLANNPETQAFVQAYRAEMEDDNEEFAHLDRDEMALHFIGENNLGDENDEDEEEEEPPEVVTTVQLQEELRKVARGEKVVETINTHDVDWVLDDEDDMAVEDVRIKEVASTSKKAPANRGANPGYMEWEPIQSHRGNSVHDLSRQQKWARGEGGSRNAGTGRASAVTGIGKSVKSGGGSLTGRRGEQGQSREKGPAKLVKAPSILSAVSSRRTKFA